MQINGKTKSKLNTTNKRYQMKLISTVVKLGPK